MAAVVVPQGSSTSALPLAVRPVRRRDPEPALLAALAAGGALAAWTSGARSGPWSAALAVAVLAVTAALAGRGERRTPGAAHGTGPALARAVVALAAAAVAAGAHPGPAPLALAWLPAVCAAYVLVLPPRPAAVVMLGALSVVGALAAAAGQDAYRPSTAYAACAVCVIAAGLAAGTLRAVLDTAPAVAAAGGSPGDAEPATPPDVTSSLANSPLATSSLGTSPHAIATVAVPRPAVHGAAALAPASLPGRERLLESVAAAQARSGVVGGRVGLLVVRLHGLGELPAAVGRHAAQGALDALTRRAKASLPAGDVLAWLPDVVDGDALAVLLEGVDVQTCASVGRRLAALLAEPVEAGGRVLTLPATIAVTLADDAQEPPSSLLLRALAAPALSPSDLVPAATAPDVAADPLADEMWAALGAGAVRVALQPIVALGTLPRHDRVVALEALARWSRDDGFAVPPARFVTAARRAGLADLLGATVLAQGLDALVARRQDTGATLALAVNVAPEQLTGPAAAAAVLEALQVRGLEPSALAVELSASAPPRDAVGVATLRELREAGVGVVLDNFGTPGLSLAALRDLPLTGVKLDRSLVADLGTDDRLVVATLRLATRLGLTCTAVGIERPEQLEAARALGVDAAQGHLLGRPEAAAAQPPVAVPTVAGGASLSPA